MLVLDGYSATAALAFTPDSKQLLVGQQAGSLDAWAFPDGTRTQLLDRERGANPILAVHPSGQRAFVVSNQTLTVISLADRAARQIGPSGNFMVSPRGDWLIASSAKGQPHRVDGVRCDEHGELAGGPAWAVAPHTNAETLCGFISAGDQFVTADRKTLVVRSSATGVVSFTVPYPSHYVGHPTISPDGSRFAVMGYGQLYLWDTAAWGKPRRVECNSSRWFIALAFHPTRPILAGIQWGQTLVKFLDADTGKPVRKFQWKLGDMRCIAFSPDGTLAAAGSESGKIVVWDVDE